MPRRFPSRVVGNFGTMLYILLLSMVSGFGIYHSAHRFDGIVGMTKKNGSGCYCHGPFPTPSVRVWVDGPDTVQAGEAGLFTISVSKESSLTAGFNVAALRGTLEVVDSLESYWYEGELTHTSPKPSGGRDTIAWQFRYVAPGTSRTLIDTIYSVANSTNQDTSATEEDKWNFGDNFAVLILGGVTAVQSDGGGELPGFRLHQNYPNPFNPSTNIEFEISFASHVVLSVFDLSGRLVSETPGSDYAPGVHTIRFSTEGQRLASGTYVYRVAARMLDENSARTVSGKMLLLQ